MSVLSADPKENKLARRMFWVVLICAAVFRVLFLDLKPAHFDEGINGWFVDQMVKNGCYQYDPTNYHGPLHFYVEFLSLTVFGRNLWALRLPVVVVGLLTIWMAWAFRRFLGNRAALLAAAGMALSPGFVFFQRYAIHETWLVLFLMQLVWGILELVAHGSRRGLFAVVVGATGCVLTKETYAIHFVAIGLTFLTCAIWQKLVPVVPEWPRAKPRWKDDELWKVLTLAVFAIIFFYSGNFFDGARLRGIFTTFLTWSHTGVDSAGHMKNDQQLAPFLNYYWLWLGWKFEPLMLLGVAGAVAAIGSVPGPVRWLAVYAMGCLAAYSLIPYKTPWCVIAIAWPFYLIAGHFLDRMLTSRWKWTGAAVLVAALIFSSARAIELNFRRFDDDRLPYIYVQTYRDVNQVLDPIRELIKRDPEKINLRGRVHLDSYYPLPWYWGDFTQIYYPKSGVYQEDEDSDFLICDSSRVRELAAHLSEGYFLVPFRLRSGQDPCTAFFNASVFDEEFPGKAPDLPARIPEK